MLEVEVANSSGGPVDADGAVALAREVLAAEGVDEGELGIAFVTAEEMRSLKRAHLGVDEAKVTENASFVDDLGADSLDTVELVMAFEEEFGCEIPDDAAEKILTVKDAIAYIQEHS